MKLFLSPSDLNKFFLWQIDLNLFVYLEQFGMKIVQEIDRLNWLHKTEIHKREKTSLTFKNHHNSQRNQITSINGDKDFKSLPAALN